MSITPRWRVIIVRVSILVNLASLLLLVVVPSFAHHAMARGLGVAVSAAIGIPAALFYLRSRR